MSKKFTTTEQYDADMDAMWAMMSQREHYLRKFEACGATNVSLTTFTADGDSITVVNERDVPADLPGFAKKIIGDTNHVTQTERWTRAGDSASCAIEIAVKNLPGGTTGTMSITPSGSGCTQTADLDIKIPVPLVGGRLEGLMHEQTGVQFAEEKAFKDSWLAEQAS